MKYLKIATTLLLLVAVVANFTFAAGVKTAGRLQLPQRTQEQLTKGGVKTLPSNVSVSKEDNKRYSRARTVQSVIRKAELTKLNRQVPPEILSGGLSGTFHIGTANQFKTIADMAFLMNIANISGPVTFLLDDASYTEAGVVIGNSPGSSATNNITIRPNTGNTNCVITLTNNAGAGGLVFDGAQHVTVEGTAVGQSAGSRNLTVKLSASPTTVDSKDSPVRLHDCQNMTITDAIITGNSPGQVWSDLAYAGQTAGNASVYITADSGNYSSFVTVNNCDLSLGHFGVLSEGNYLLDADHYGVQDDDIMVTNNWIHDVTEGGVKLSQVTLATVSGNTIQRVVLGSLAGASPNLQLEGAGVAPDLFGLGLANFPLYYRVAGIFVWGDLAVINQNKVDSVYNNRTSTGTFGAQTFGIYLSAFGNNDPDPEFGGGLSMAGITSGNMIKNNIITRLYSKAVQNNGLKWHEVGIKMQSGRWDTVLYNTVYFSGAENATNPGAEVCLVVEGVTTTPPSVFGGNAGFPVWTLGSSGPNLFSYRVVVVNNVFAIDRTGGTSVSSVMGIQNATSSAGFVSDYRPPSDHNVLFQGVTGGTVVADSRGNNYASLFAWQGGAPTVPVDAASQADSPTLTSASDVHINPAGFSTADGTGIAYSGVTTDFGGTTRSTPPDIGAYEGTGAGAPHDVKPIALIAPSPAGVPAGLPFSGFQFSALNLASSSETAVPANIHIVAPDLSTVDFPGTFDVGAGALATVSISGTWTPPVGGNYVFTITTALGTDNYPGNDAIVVNVPVAGQSTVPYSSGFETVGEQAGWFGSGDWGLGTTGGKLGGPHAGTKYYATKPGAAGTANYSDASVSYLYTPFFDLTAAGSATMSFYLSLKTEPSWDKMIVEYTLDTGKTWHQVGTLNDAAGINWYSTAVYQNAAGSNTTEVDCWDEVTATAKGFPTDSPGTLVPAFTSNGDCVSGHPDVHTGPNGYILVAYTFDGLAAPVSPLGKSFVRFRMTSFGDASGGDDGFAIDDFTLGASPASNNADFSGKVYTDVDGNGIFDGADAGISGATVTLTYFGGATAKTAVTDGSGNYTLTTPNGMYLPGVYNVTVAHAGAQSQASADANYTGNGTASSGHNIGFYDGSISGKVYLDVNNNGGNDAEAGLAGFTVSVHKDSLTGASKGSVTTAADGNYSFALLPGTYYVSVSKDTVHYRGTQVANYNLTVSGNGGSGTAVYTGKDFGFFKYATERVTATLDQNGNGTVDVTDIAVLPSGVFAAFTLKKGLTTVHTDTIGSGVKEYTVAGLDTGNYTVQINVGAPDQTGYVITSSTSRSFSVTSGGGTLDTSKFLWYKKASVSGIVYGDADGSGAKNGAEAGVAGWVVKIDGNPADTSDATGAWSVAGALTPGSHTVSLTSQAGYSYTQGSSNYTFSPNTGQSVTARDFGVFAQFSISGSAYRDRDDNGAKNGADDALAGVIISLSKNGSPAGADTTDAGGLFSFPSLGPGAYVVSATEPSGYGQTEPESTYAVAGTSGVNSSSNAFGFFHLTDSVKYRTITAADIFAGGKPKPATNLKKDTVGNFANLLNDQIANTYVGITTADKKAAAWFLPKKYSDVQASTGADGKSSAHSGTPTGFDFNAKGKLMLGRLTALKSTVQDNVLFANLLALRINIAASEHGTTPAGFSSLIINDGSMFNGMTISAFATKMDTLMSYWKKIPQSTYTAANTLAANINSAFNAPFVVDQPSFRADGKIHLTGTVTVYSVAFLLPASKIVPKTPAPPTVEEAPIPTVYALYQNYPNPFNPTTNIRFDLPMTSIVTVKIYNMIGQEVATLVDHQMVDAGTQEMPFNASSLASGVYFYRVTAEGTNAEGLNTGDTFSKVMKMALIK